MKTERRGFLNTLLAIIFFVTVLLAIASGYYRYVYTKDYNYLIETDCDPVTENCFYRDCEDNPDDCPPNNLSYYSQYYVKAYDFATCRYNSCKLRCASGEIACVPVACDSTAGDVCSEEVEQ